MLMKLSLCSWVYIFQTQRIFKAVFFLTGFVNKTTKSIYLGTSVFYASISEAMSVNIECMIEFLLKANESLYFCEFKGCNKH